MISWRYQIIIFFRRVRRTVNSWREPPPDQGGRGYASYLAFRSALSARRLLFIAAAFGVWFLIVSARLVNVQFANHTFFSEQGQRLTRAKFSIPAVRGEILGRHGWILATDISGVSFYAVPYEVEDVNATATRLGSLLGRGSDEFAVRLLTGKEEKREFVWLARKLVPVDKTDELPLVPGVYRLIEPKRIYPYGTFAASLLGFVGLDHTGLFGVELTQNKYLEGRAFEVFATDDPTGKVFDYPKTANVRGHDVILTVDEYLQTKATLLAEAAIRDADAEAISLVIIKPQTGEVLSLVTLPTFDPGAPKETDLRRYRLPPVEDVYELESISGIFRSSLQLEASSSDNRNSSRDRTPVAPIDLNSHLLRMGFGQKTGIEFPGEASGIVGEDSSRVNGLTIKASSIQLLSAFAAIGNRGIWVQPRLVNRIDTSDGRTAYTPTSSTRVVFDERVVRTLIDTLRRTYHNKESPWAERYQAAAAISYGSQVKERKSVLTVVGVAPANSPEYAVIVTFVDRAGKRTPERIATRTFDQIVKAAFGGYSIEEPPARAEP